MFLDIKSAAWSTIQVLTAQFRLILLISAGNIVNLVGLAKYSRVAKGTRLRDQGPAVVTALIK